MKNENFEKLRNLIEKIGFTPSVRVLRAKTRLTVYRSLLVSKPGRRATFCSFGRQFLKIEFNFEISMKTNIFPESRHRKLVFDGIIFQNKHPNLGF